MLEIVCHVVVGEASVAHHEAIGLLLAPHPSRLSIHIKEEQVLTCGVADLALWHDYTNMYLKVQLATHFRLIRTPKTDFGYIFCVMWVLLPKFIPIFLSYNRFNTVFLLC